MKKKSESLNKDENPKIMKRKSKNELEGRNFFCEKCNKSYLSYPALYTHKKIKHEPRKSEARGRGRPKKEQNENIIEKNRYNPINITFFAKEGRTGKTPITEINKSIDSAFNDLYNEVNIKINESRNMKHYQTLEEHPFLNKFKNDSHDIYRNVINLHEVIDTVFIDYLNKMSSFCSSAYYIELIKFVTLFREHINIINRKNKSKKENIEFTESNDAESLPYYCNSFINKFLYPNGNDDGFSFSKDDSIDLIQNICYWIFDNNFTSSKICLRK
jgi:hypothetical protein